MIRHRNKQDQNGKQQNAHHKIVYIFPFVFESQPSRQRCAHLPQNHKKQINYRLADTFLYIQLIPSHRIFRLHAGSDITRCLHTKSIFNQCKQIDHHQHHTQEPCQQTTKRQQKDTVSFGTHITENIHKCKATYAHQLLPAYANQFIQKRSKRCHTDRGHKISKLNMLGNNA